MDDQTRTLADRRLTYLLKRAERTLADLHLEALAPLDINVRELGVMLVIDSSEPASQQQIADRMSVDRTTMVAIVDSLEAKGLIARRPDTGDRRRNVIDLTALGQQRLRQATAASDRAEAQLLSALSREENAQLRHLLANILVPD